MGVAHLNTIRPRPNSVRASVGRANSSGRQMATGQRAQARPDGDSLRRFSLHRFPRDAATIYDTPNSFNANFSSGTSYTGAGVNIGIGGDATITASIVGTYRSTFLGSSTTPILNYCTSSSSCSGTATGSGSGYECRRCRRSLSRHRTFRRHGSRRDDLLLCFY